MKFETAHSFSHPWSLLTFANWRKYPNEHATHVLSVDVLARRVDPASGVLETQRLLRCKQAVPSIFKTLGINMSEEAFFLETSTLDPQTQVYTAKTVNLSLRSLFTAEETCVFKPDPVNPLEHTLFSQKAEITTGATLSFFSRLVEDAFVKRFKANAEKGRRGLESVVQAVVAEAQLVENKVAEGIKEGLSGLEGFASTLGANAPAR
ncbi:PRELI-like family-domain-containing protein [Entophlyctis helioformis]|nr:PRELI-like family-domain-containing protein [Entophlyctis helioformis]